MGSATLPAQQQSQGQVFEFLPGVASLVEDLDKRVLVTLRDGRHFVGEHRQPSHSVRSSTPILLFFLRFSHHAVCGRHDAVIRPVRQRDVGRYI